MHRNQNNDMNAEGARWVKENWGKYGNPKLREICENTICKYGYQNRKVGKTNRMKHETDTQGASMKKK